MVLDQLTMYGRDSLWPQGPTDRPAVQHTIPGQEQQMQTPMMIKSAMLPDSRYHYPDRKMAMAMGPIPRHANEMHRRGLTLIYCCRDRADQRESNRWESSQCCPIAAVAILMDPCQSQNSDDGGVEDSGDDSEYSQDHCMCRRSMRREGTL
jgi:hypothetical protein